MTISGAPGLPPKFAVPDFIALSSDAETVAAAKTIGEVLWDDLNFEREFYLIPRDTYRTHPASDLGRRGAARSVEAAGRRRRGRRHRPARRPSGVIVQVRLIDVASGTHRVGQGVQRQPQEPRQPAAVRAHGVRRDPPAAASAARRGADEAGVLVGSGRRAHEGAGRRSRHLEHLHLRLRRREPERITVTRSLNITPVWSPDGQVDRVHVATARDFPDIIVQYIYEARAYTKPAERHRRTSRTTCRRGRPTARSSRSCRSRDGNPEIYVMNSDGSGLRRLTNHPEIDVTPTWSPTGTRLRSRRIAPARRRSTS